jgi:hypothetical protein
MSGASLLCPEQIVVDVIVNSMVTRQKNPWRVFGLGNLRVAIAASLVSRRRFESWVIAPKTGSERIVFPEA